MSTLEHQLRTRFDRRLRANQPLAAMTSFRIGGPADLLVIVENDEELSFALAAAHRAVVGAFCLGAGTNLLVSDRGIRGLVVRLGDGFRHVDIDGLHVTAGGAVDFGHLVETVVERGLAGLEFGEGIPGTVGGGLVMNAGAFGGEMAKVVTRVHGVAGDGERRALSPQDVKFSYRRTDLPRGFVITRVDFELRVGDRTMLDERMMDLRSKRAARQPRDIPNAGSVFKNPPGDFAGKLLEGAGLKGLRHGGAQFSEQHANFIVNLGGACADDVRTLMEMARRTVAAHSGVWLEPEVRLVGDW